MKLKEKQLVFLLVILIILVMLPFIITTGNSFFGFGIKLFLYVVGNIMVLSSFLLELMELAIRHIFITLNGYKEIIDRRKTKIFKICYFCFVYLIYTFAISTIKDPNYGMLNSMLLFMYIPYMSVMDYNIYLGDLFLLVGMRIIPYSAIIEANILKDKYGNDYVEIVLSDKSKIVPIIKNNQKYEFVSGIKSKISVDREFPCSNIN